MDAPLVHCSVTEPLNAMSLQANNNFVENSMFCFPSGSGYNSKHKASMSGRIFVLSYEGKPLTPCKISKARKLMEGKVAKPLWNKFHRAI